MDKFQYHNAATSTLAALISDSATSLTVSNPGRFPTSLPSGYRLVMTLHSSGLPSTQEIVICTDITAGVFTVTRGAQGTTPVAWPAGTVVGAYLTAEMLKQIADEVRDHVGVGGTSHPAATAGANGFMTAANVTKLAGIESGAQVNANISKAEIEAKLTGSITSHSHPSSAWTLQTGNFSAAVGGKYLLAAGVDCTLPASPTVGDVIEVKAAGTAAAIAADPPTLLRNGNAIFGDSEDKFLNGLGTVTLTWAGSSYGGWV